MIMQNMIIPSMAPSAPKAALTSKRINSNTDTNVTHITLMIMPMVDYTNTFVVK